MNIMIKTSLILVALFSQAATAAAITRVDAKELLQVTEGEYSVTKTDSALDGDLLCQADTSAKVKWAGSVEAPLLVIGGSAPFREFNNGLRKTSVEGDKDQCKFTHSTLAEAAKMIDDSYTNCVSQNTHTHTEMVFKKDAIEVSVKVSVSQGGKVLEAPATCTLKLIPAKK